jgi:hypothetical protein
MTYFSEVPILQLDTKTPVLKSCTDRENPFFEIFHYSVNLLKLLETAQSENSLVPVVYVYSPSYMRETIPPPPPPHHQGRIWTARNNMKKANDKE